MRCFSILLVCLFLAGSAHSDPQSPDSVEWGPWWVILPFEHPAGGANIKKDYSPEDELRRHRAGGPGPKLERRHKRKDKFTLTWQALNPEGRQVPDFAVVDFLTLVPEELKSQEGVSSDRCMAYAYRTITSSVEQTIQMKIGSDDGCLAWLNGQQVYAAARTRGIDPIGDDLVLNLSVGTNHLMMKVPNEGGAWGVHVHPPAEHDQEAVQLVPQGAINDAIDRGVLYLLKSQLLDGSWDYHHVPYRNGQTALAVYALLKSGLDSTHPCIRRAFQYMETKPSSMTYELACEMLAKKARGSKQDLKDVQEMGQTLEEWERQGFSYPEGEPCLSNSQYGAMGMLLAQKEGARIDAKVWNSLIRFALRSQNEDGGFGYRNGVASTGSMTVAGLIVLRAAELSFGKKGLPVKVRDKHEESVARGKLWMAENFLPDANPKAQDNSDRWLYYYLYGVERFAALNDIVEIGEHDWYGEGASFLVRNQQADGSWGSRVGENEPNTAFALIFLNRATAAVTGQTKTNNRTRNYVTDESSSSVVLRATGDTPLNLWVSGFHEDEIEDHMRTVRGKSGLFIERVEYFADGELAESVAADASRPWDHERFAIQHKFNTRREHTVQVRVHLAQDPGDPANETVVLSSPELKVRIDEGAGLWMLTYADDWMSNLLLQQPVQATATSQRDDGNRAALAVDGRWGTGWSSGANEATPSLTLDFDSGARADTVVLSHRTSTELMRGEFDRATRVEITVNGESDTYEFDVNPDEDYKTELELPKSMRIHQLTIRVLERIKGTRYPGNVGFAEVELRLGS